jgi:glycosyltransferase involved in cell wall biosynthesis
VKLSVVMAVRDGESFLREAIDSVLGQSFTDFELLIVDDGSTDETPAILDAYRRMDSRVVVLRNDSNLGPYPSANRALMQARGTVIARHDADDISDRDRFGAQLEALESAADVALVVGAFVIGAGAHVMFPRVFQGTRILFPLRRRYAEDYALWCQLVRLGRVACPAQVVYRYRQHGASITSLNGVQQYRCLSEIRHEYQAQYLGPDVSLEESVELSRFWLLAGASPIVSLRRTAATLTRLRHGFLSYVERRYGASDRAALEAQLDEDLVERLGFWLARSIKSHDPRAVGDLLRVAGGEGRIMGASGNALRHASGAAFRRFAKHRRAEQESRTP